MSKNLPIRRLLWAALSLLLLAAGPLPSSFGNPSDPGQPDGFRLVAEANGVQLFRKDYNQGNPDYVQVIDLSRGASLKLLHGDITKDGEGRGVYGGDNPRLTSKSLEKYWSELSAENPTAFCVTNGQFFYMPEYPTRLAFPIKKDGKVVTDGYGIKEYPDQKLMLELWEDRADINPLSAESLYASTAPNIIGGLMAEANKRAQRSVGRTFTGVDDRDQNGAFETVLIFNTLSAKQSDAAEILQKFGADKVMMLDGGGSTQLICKDKSYIDSERLVPQAVGVVAAGGGPSLTGPPASAAATAASGLEAVATPPPTEAVAIGEPASTLLPLSFSLLRQPVWPVVNEGDQLSAEFVVENTGSEVWPAGLVYLVLEGEGWGSEERLPLQADAQPGSSAVFSWTSPPLSEAGVFSATWRLAMDGNDFPGEPILFHMVVLPEELAGQRPDLLAKLDLWGDERAEDIGQRVQDWILQHTQNASPEREAESDASYLQGVIWVPASMAPVVAILFIAINKKRRTDY